MTCLGFPYARWTTQPCLHGETRIRCFACLVLSLLFLYHRYPTTEPNNTYVVNHEAQAGDLIALPQDLEKGYSETEHETAAVYQRNSQPLILLPNGNGVL